jgi:hypothetical protein
MLSPEGLTGELDFFASALVLRYMIFLTRKLFCWIKPILREWTAEHPIADATETVLLHRVKTARIFKPHIMLLTVLIDIVEKLGLVCLMVLNVGTISCCQPDCFLRSDDSGKRPLYPRYFPILPYKGIPIKILLRGITVTA